MSLRVFITGASSGIGLAFAQHYAREGSTLGLVGRRLVELERVARALGAPAGIYSADVADAEAMQRAAGEFVAQFGPPDIVIANAGISVGTLGGNADDLPVLERVVRTNVIGLAATIQPFIAPMRARGRGSIVGIASVAGVRGLPGAGAYSASKAAAIAWLESLRVELRGSGVSVTTICPGYIDTPMTRVNTYPMPFLLAPEEAARRMARLIAARRRVAVVPWQMAVVAYVLRRLPAWLYDRLFARAPHKPRNLPT